MELDNKIKLERSIKNLMGKLALCEYPDFYKVINIPFAQEEENKIIDSVYNILFADYSEEDIIKIDNIFNEYDNYMNSN